MKDIIKHDQQLRIIAVIVGGARLALELLRDLHIIS